MIAGQYSILTPYLIPSELAQTKRVNIGDGFVLNAAISLLAPLEAKHIYSTRAPLSAEQIDNINDTKALLIAGTNQLSDDFTVAPGFGYAELDKLKVPIIPFGLGITGVPAQNQHISKLAAKLLMEMHERIAYSSWRCPLTIRYIQRNVPSLSEKLLLTGCPVMFGDRVLSNVPFENDVRKVVVTFTDRGDFLDREIKTLQWVARTYPSAEKVVSIHQWFLGESVPMPPRRSYLARVAPGIRRLVGDRQRGRLLPLFVDHLLQRAATLGFSVFRADSVRAYQELYQRCDHHFGSRIHAHLHFLAHAKQSYLTTVDQRSVGFSEMLGFPLCQPGMFDSALGWDVETYRERVKKQFIEMEVFTRYVKATVCGMQ